MKLFRLLTLSIFTLFLTNCSEFPDYWYLEADLTKKTDISCIEKVLIKHTPQFQEFFSKAPFGSWLRRNSDFELKVREKELLNKRGTSLVIGFGIKDKKIRFGIGILQGALRTEDQQVQSKFLSLVPEYKDKVKEIIKESNTQCDLKIVQKEFSSDCKGLLCK